MRIISWGFCVFLALGARRWALGQSEVLILHLGGGLEELTPCGKILELRQLATKLAEPKAWRVMNVED